MKTNFYALLVALFFISGLNLSAQTYNEHDLTKLKAFMEQASGNKRNIDILWDNAPATLSDDGSDWVSGLGGVVKWTNDGRLKYIEAKYKDLVGGIDFEDCGELAEIYLRNNKLTSLNVKGCAKLEMLYVCLNQIGSFNVEGCYKIREIASSGNTYAAIDLSNRAQLTKLYLPANYNLSSLNVKGCSALKDLTFTKGHVSSIDLNDCTNLVSLECFGNKIASLDVSKSPKLKTLAIQHKDNISTYTNPLTSLNISGCQQLESYDFIAIFTGLTSLNISNCGLSAVDLSKNTNLTKLEAGSQNLSVAKQIAEDGKIKLEALKNKDITITPSDNGVFDAGFVTWENLPLGDGTYSYLFKTPLPAGVTGTALSGTVSVPWSNSQPPVSNIEVNGNSPVIYSVDGRLSIQTEKPQTVQVFTLTGQMVSQLAAVTNVTIPLTKGIYIVRLGDNTIQKVVVR